MKYALVALCTALCGPAANAAVIVNLTETPLAWTAEYAGTLDVSDLTRANFGTQTRRLSYNDPTFFSIAISEETTGGVERYSIANGGGDVPTEPGVQLFMPRFESTVTGAGPMFALQVESPQPERAYIAVASGFESGFIEGFTRWPGVRDGPMGLTLADSMLREGRYVYGLANGETVTLNIGNAYAQPLPVAPGVPEVPLPAALPLLAGGMAALAWLRRRPTA